jgi:hypothetical protein
VGRNTRLESPRQAFQSPSGADESELSHEKYHFTFTSPAPSLRKRVLEVMRQRFEGVVGGKFIESVRGIDEL